MMSKFVTNMYVRSCELQKCGTPSKGNQRKFVLNATPQKIWVKEDALGYEGASEVIASRIALNTNWTDFFPVTVYNPCFVVVDNIERYKRTGCYAQDFHRQGVQEISFERLCQKVYGRSFYELKKYGRGNIEQFYTQLLNEFQIPFLADYLHLLFAFDALIYNEDRHTANILLLREHTAWIPAPLFDNGAGFFSDTRFTYPLDLSFTACEKKVKSKPFVTSFTKQTTLSAKFTDKRLIIRNNAVQTSDLYLYYAPQVLKRIEQVLRMQGFTTY